MKQFLYENNSLSYDICDKIVELFDKDTNKADNNFKKILVNLDISAKMTESNEYYPIVNILIKELEKNIESYYAKLDNNIYFFDVTHKTKSIDKFSIQRFISSQTHKSEFMNDNNKINYNDKLKILKFIWYLNDIDDGETLFLMTHKIKPEKGKMVIFPSDWFFPFEERYSKTNDKYIITGNVYIDI